MKDSETKKKVNSKSKSKADKSLTSRQRRMVRRKQDNLIHKTTPLIAVLLILILIAGSLFYHQSDAFRGFIDGLGILPTTSTQGTTRSFTDTSGNELSVHFIDVGQGDSTLLLSSAGAVLIDCGTSEHGNSIVAYLGSLGIDELEYFIITHPDADHMGGASKILEELEVKHFVINGKEKTANFFSKALDVMEEKGIPGLIASAGDTFTVGALRLDVLSPTGDEISGLTSNDSSLVIRATYGSRSFLFTGDAEEEGEELLLEKCGADALASDVFSAGHHGSRTSNSSALLELVSPKYVVISCGDGNSYGHPHTEALDAFESIGATVLRTDKLGTVVFVTDGTDLYVK